MLKFTNKNFINNINNINNINKIYLKDKSLILYTILASLLFIENTIFFFDKEYKYNIFTVLSLTIIYLYFNSIKYAIITAILIINIYYLLYKNIYESFDEYAANTACANLTGTIEEQYNEKADEKYYEYCKLSGLKRSLHNQPTNLIINGGVMYPYDAAGDPIPIASGGNKDFRSSIAYTNDTKITTLLDDAPFHRHDLSFRQWMIYNYESLNNNNIPVYGSFKRDEDDAPKDTAIISITDAYIKNLQDRGISNCTSVDNNFTNNNIVNEWAGYNDVNTVNDGNDNGDGNGDVYGDEGS